MLVEARSAKAEREVMEEGDGRGWEPVMKTLSDRGVWFPPRPLEGGTPVSLEVGTWAGCEWVVLAGDWWREARSISDWMMLSTSSMHIRTFSGLRSVCMTPQHLCM